MGHLDLGLIRIGSVSIINIIELELLN